MAVNLLSKINKQMNDKKMGKINKKKNSMKVKKNTKVNISQNGIEKYILSVCVCVCFKRK